MTERKIDSICVSARFSALPQLLAPLSPSASWVANPQDAKTLLQAQIAVEELFANSIHHGYGGESDQPVWLSVEQDGATLRVVYVDQAQEFDPFSSINDHDDEPDATVEKRLVGGLGRLLVRELARNCTYAREADRNVTQLEFALAPPPAANGQDHGVPQGRWL